MLLTGWKYIIVQHIVTGFAPKYLLYGTDVSFLPKELTRDRTEVEWITDRKLAFENSIKSHNYNKKHMIETKFNMTLIWVIWSM